MTVTLPPLYALSDALSLVHRVHGAIRAAQRVGTFSSSPVEALFGNGLYLAVRELEPVRAAAQALLIARRTLLCIDAVDKIQKIFREVTATLEENKVPCRLVRERLLSRSLPWYTAQIIQAAPGWLIEARYTLSIVIKKIITLSLAILHTAVSFIALFEATIPDEITAYEGISEIASNAHEVYHAFQQGAPRLVQAIRCHQAIIDHILSRTGVPVRCHDILWCAGIAESLSLADQKASIIFQKLQEILSHGIMGLFDRAFTWDQADGLQAKNTLHVRREYYYS